MNLEWLIYLDKEGKDGTNSMLKTYFNISGVVTTQRPSVGKKDMSPITLEKKGILNISWDHGCMWILPDPSRCFDPQVSPCLISLPFLPQPLFVRAVKLPLGIQKPILSGYRVLKFIITSCICCAFLFSRSTDNSHLSAYS